MTARRLSVLFAVGILVVALAAWVSSRNQTGADSIAGATVLPGLEGSLNQVTRVRITKADHTQTTLERQANDWVVAERGYRADTGKLRKLLLDLGSLKAIERKTRLAGNYHVLGVQDVTSPKATGARVDIEAAGRTWSLIVGNSADGNDGYVRVVDSPQSLLARPLIEVAADPKLWLEPTLLDIDQKRVSGVLERPAHGPGFSTARAKNTQTDFTVQGIPRGRELSAADAADSLASALSSLSLTDVRRAAAPPAGSALSHAVFKTFDGLEIDVSGYQQDKADYIDVSAKATGDPAAAEARQINSRVQGWDYEIADYRYGEIFPTLDSLLKPLPAKKPHAKTRAHHAK